jgi:hypothetical protein
MKEAHHCFALMENYAEILNWIFKEKAIPLKIVDLGLITRLWSLINGLKQIYQ